MTLEEARNLQIGDVVVHKFLKTEWTVGEVRVFKSNDGKFRHVLQLNGRFRKTIFTEKGLHLWTINS